MARYAIRDTHDTFDTPGRYAGVSRYADTPEYGDTRNTRMIRDTRSIRDMPTIRDTRDIRARYATSKGRARAHPSGGRVPGGAQRKARHPARRMISGRLRYIAIRMIRARYAIRAIRDTPQYARYAIRRDMRYADTRYGYAIRRYVIRASQPLIYIYIYIYIYTLKTYYITPTPCY